MLLKKYILAILVLAFTQLSANDSILEYAQTQPSFIGGNDSLLKYIYNQLEYPLDDILSKNEGIVYVKFIVDKEGKVTNPKIIKSTIYSDEARTEALRIVNEMPNWNPGKNKNEIVNVYFTLPIKFKITLKESTFLADIINYNTLNDISFLPVNNKACKNIDLEIFPNYKDESIYSFINKNIKYPTSIKDKNIQGKIIANFLINNEGAGSNLNIVYNTTNCNDCETAVLEMFQKMSYWKPAMNCNEPITVSTFIPIEFNINNNKQAQIDSIQGEKPEFIGGTKAMLKFIADSLVYPKKEKNNKIQGTVYVQFIINEDGSITDPTVLKNASNNKNFAVEAINVINKMPNWKPAIQNGVAVKIKYSLPIQFNIPDEHLELVKESFENIVTQPCNGENKAAEYKNGNFALKSYIENNIKYPKEANQQNMEGQVTVQFIVDEEGLVKAPKVIKGNYIQAYTTEALRIINHMPKWNPQLICGQAVKSIQKITIDFNIKY